MNIWDWMLIETPPRRVRIAARLAMKALLVGGFLLIAGVSLAYAANCSQTVGASSAAVPFPTTGSGPSLPESYLVICNAHASNTLGLNDVGGTAAIGSAGTLTLQPGGCKWYEGPNQMPQAPHVIGSGANTTTACFYR
jgi:hypothetical protein